MALPAASSNLNTGVLNDARCGVVDFLLRRAVEQQPSLSEALGDSAGGAVDDHDADRDIAPRRQPHGAAVVAPRRERCERVKRVARRRRSVAVLDVARRRAAAAVARGIALAVSRGSGVTLAVNRRRVHAQRRRRRRRVG